MAGVIYQKSYTLPEVDVREVLRYAGARGNEAEEISCLSEILSEVNSSVCARAVFMELPVRVLSQGVEIGNIKINSLSLMRHLSGSERCAVFFATVGIGVDRLIRKYGAISPLFALVSDAAGSERAEALAEAVSLDIKNLAMAAGYKTTARFSPGYADFPLEHQRDFFELLSVKTKIGVSLSESFLLSPRKTVSAVIGYEK